VLRCGTAIEAAHRRDAVALALVGPSAKFNFPLEQVSALSPEEIQELPPALRALLGRVKGGKARVHAACMVSCLYTLILHMCRCASAFEEVWELPSEKRALLWRVEGDQAGVALRAVL
jgi:hypothetical protein